MAVSTTRPSPLHTSSDNKKLSVEERLTRLEVKVNGFILALNKFLDTQSAIEFHAEIARIRHENLVKRKGR